MQISKDSILRTRFFWTMVSMVVFTMLLVAYSYLVLAPQNDVIYDDNLKQVKSMECPLLKEKIYNKDFEHWYRISDDAIFEYEWRCEK